MSVRRGEQRSESALAHRMGGMAGAGPGQGSGAHGSAVAGACSEAQGGERTPCPPQIQWWRMDTPDFPNRAEGRAVGRPESNHEPACGTQHPQAALPNLASTLLHSIPHSSFLQTLQLFQRYNKLLKTTRKKRKVTAFQQRCTPKPRPVAAHGLQPWEENNYSRSNLRFCSSDLQKFIHK